MRSLTCLSTSLRSGRRAPSCGALPMGTSEIATRPLHASARSKRAISERAQEHAPPFRAGVLDRHAYALIFAPTPHKPQIIYMLFSPETACAYPSTPKRILLRISGG